MKFKKKGAKCYSLLFLRATMPRATMVEITTAITKIDVTGTGAALFPDPESDSETVGIS